MKWCFCNMQGNHIQSTPCVFSLQPALCAWKYYICPFRGTPRTVFSNFPSFGTLRKLVFQIFRASGPPESLFLEILRLRGIPKHCFSEFQPFGMPRSSTFPVFLLVACERNAVFRIFCISLTSDRPFSPFFARRSRATNDFQHFQPFPRGGKAVLAVISFSLMRESRFFADFLFSPVKES